MLARGTLAVGPATAVAGTAEVAPPLATAVALAVGVGCAAFGWTAVAVGRAAAAVARGRLADARRAPGRLAATATGIAAVAGEVGWMGVGLASGLTRVECLVDFLGVLGSSAR
jgi:hypothetical protein